MPVVTAASTPEAPTALAGTNAAYPLTSEIVTLICGSGVRLRTSAITHPTANPDRAPARGDRDERQTGGAERERARHDRGNCDAVSDQRGGVVEQPLSLDRADQPAWHTSRLRMITPAANGSVGETIAPRTNDGAQAMPITSCATNATAVIVASTRPTEMSVIERRNRLMSAMFAKNAAP